MTMGDFYAKYAEEKKLEKEDVSAYESELENIERQLEELQEKRDELSTKIAELRDRYPYSYIDAAQELAEVLAGKIGADFKVTGPQGICSRMTIFLSEKGDRWPYSKPYRMLSVEPRFPQDDVLAFRWRTDRYVERFAKGSLGEINGMNYETEDLPDDLDDVLRLFKTCSPEVEGLSA